MLVLPEGLEPSTTRLSTVRVCQLRHNSNESNWYRRRDSNPHCLVPKTSASSRLGYAGMVNPAGLERATSTFAESCSDSAELQVRCPPATAGGSDNLAKAAGVKPGHAMRGDLANRCHTIRRRLRENLPARYRRRF